MDFKEFPKISRLSREIVITEKIDGTNASITITEDGQFLTGSRTRWITPEEDNFGFSKWAHANREELVAGLGVGSHFGEWWGSGVQRGYGLEKGEKRWSLFNVHKWGESRPACCSVVPVLSRGVFDSLLIKDSLENLRLSGSAAAPGFFKPEGIVIFHTASGHLYKKTLDKDDEYKGKQG
jgi:hypothetical protein